jgi:hypothetical protein
MIHWRTLLRSEPIAFIPSRRRSTPRASFYGEFCVRRGLVHMRPHNASLHLLDFTIPKGFGSYASAQCPQSPVLHYILTHPLAPLSSFSPSSSFTSLQARPAAALPGRHSNATARHDQGTGGTVLCLSLSVSLSVSISLVVKLAGTCGSPKKVTDQVTTLLPIALCISAPH